MCELGRVNNWQRSAAFGLIYKQSEAFPLKEAILVISDCTCMQKWDLFNILDFILQCQAVECQLKFNSYLTHLR